MSKSASGSVVVLAADPAWQFSDKLPGKKRGAESHYRCLTLEQIKAFPLPLPVVNAPDAILFMWRVAAMQQEALDVARAWGFEPYGELIWQKLTKTGLKHFGMGHITRASHESCLIAVRGKVPPAVRNERSTFEARVGVHSEKPAAFYRLVERLYPHAHRYEIFSRRPRTGWAQYGNELGKLEHEQLSMGGIEDGQRQAAG
jgi:N6-adenosine-specific RNA methylase IME4